jgi:hypothetical protein
MERHVECQAAPGPANRATFPSNANNLFLNCKLGEREAPEVAPKKPPGRLNGSSKSGYWSQRETLTVNLMSS